MFFESPIRLIEIKNFDVKSTYAIKQTEEKFNIRNIFYLDQYAKVREDDDLDQFKIGLL
jgi:hypothetical protein